MDDKRLRRYREALEKIERGQFANSFHDGDCLCHRCAMAPGDLRGIARKALNDDA